MTQVTLVNGQVLDVKGQYEDLKIYLNSGEKREIQLTDGSKMTLATALVGIVAEQASQQKATFGFSRALEASA